jgi:hypothetical protein
LLLELPVDGATNLVLASSGTYKILIHDASYTSTGTYGIGVQSYTGGGCDSIPLTCGQALTNSVTEFGQVQAYGFAGTSGQTVSFDFSVLTEGFSPSANLYGPSGVFLVSIPSDGATNLVLASNGTYTILVNGYGYNGLGNYALGVQSYTGGGCDSMGSLSCAQALTNQITVYAQTDAYSITGCSNEVVQLSTSGFSGSEFDLYNPNGNLVFSIGPGTTTNITFSASGIYTLLVHSSSYNGTGSYEVTLTCLSVCTHTTSTASSPPNGGGTSGGGTVLCCFDTTVCAEPAPCYNFVDWTMNGTVVSTSNCYTFAATSNTSLTANFSLITYSINTSSSPSAGGSTTGGGTVNCGTNVTVNATANPCYQFVNWTVSGTPVSSSASYTFTPTATENLVANFSQITYTISTSSSPSAGGSTSGGGTVNCGSNVCISATPNACYQFVNWTVGGVPVSTSNSYCFTASGSETVVANFNQIAYTIAASSSPTNGGTTSGGGVVDCGSNVTVVATANVGYSFTDWTEAGTNVSASASYGFTASANRSLVANFVASIASNTQPIGIYSTGLDNQFNPLPPGTSGDPHYTIISAPSGTQPTPFPAYVTNTNGCPIPTAWLADNTTSQWVSVQSNYTCSAQDPVGDYDYRTTFELTGLDPESALLTFQFIADNQLLDVRVNGTSLGITFPVPPNFTTWSGPYVISNNFVTGTNALDFIVYNSPPNGGNPSGLRVQISGTATALQTCAAVPSGLVSWWRAESNALDSVGTNNGVLTNGAGYGPGEVGTAFSFNGNNQCVVIPSSPSLSFASNAPMSVELWAFRAGSASVMHLFGKRSACSSDGDMNYQLAFNDDSGEGLCFGDGGGNEVASGLDMPTNVWIHLAGTFDGTNYCLYLNGSLIATNTGTLGPTNSAPLEIGGSDDCSGQFFDGLIDEVSLYDQALTSNEVAAIYEAGSAGKCTFCNVTISTEPAPSGGGSTSGGITTNCDATVTVCATASNCYEFVNWTLDGSNVSSSACYTFSASNSVILVGNFTPSPFYISPVSADHSVDGGQGAIFVTAPSAGCTWTATSNAGWIIITSGTNGTGNGMVTYSVLTNISVVTRVGMITVAGLTYTVTQNGATDSVGDGISDTWRQQYFGGSGTTTNRQSCATCDADGTGQNNLFKFTAGLNPTNPASVFVLQIADVTGVSTQKNLLYEPVEVERNYTVEFSLNLIGAVYTNLTGFSGPTTNGSQATVTDMGATQTDKFYRIGISLQ